MPLLIDQDRILARPGETIAATVWVENDTGAAGTFDLRVEAADPNLSDDWYDAVIEPAGGKHIPANARDSFKVRISPRWSPDGRTRLIELVVRARNARAAGAYAGPVRPAAAPRGAAPMGDLASILLGELGGGNNPAPAEEVGIPDLIADSEFGVVETHSAESSRTQSEPSLFDTPLPPPAAPRHGPLIDLRQDQQGKVTIEHAAKTAAATATIENEAEKGAAGGKYGGDIVGSIFIFVPPLPAFTVDIMPYRPEKVGGKKSPVAPEDEKNSVVSGRKSGQFTVRVTNNSKFPASFRLETSGDEGSAYHLQEQLIRVAANASGITVLSAEANSLNWWRWTRPYGFKVLTTPLTGAMQIDEKASLERLGAFRQTLAWLHPAPILLSLLALTLLGGSLMRPTIASFELDKEYVLQESLDASEALDGGVAQEAITAAKIGEQSRTAIRWKVRNAANLRLEYTGNNGGRTEVLKLDPRAGHAEISLRAADKGDDYRMELVATGPFGLFPQRQASPVPCRLLPKAGGSLEIKPLARPLTVVAPLGGKGSVTHYFRNSATNFYDITVFTALSDPQFSQIQPRNPLPAFFPAKEYKNWQFSFEPKSAGTHTCWVTVITNSTRGNVKQFKITGIAR